MSDDPTDTRAGTAQAPPRILSPEQARLLATGGVPAPPPTADAPVTEPRPASAGADQPELDRDSAAAEVDERAGFEDGPAAGSAASTRRRRLLTVVASVLVVAVAASAAFLLLRGRGALPEDAAFRAAGTVVSEEELARRTEVLRALYGVAVPDNEQARDAFRRDTAKALAVSVVLERAAEDEGVAVGEKVVRDTLDKFIEERYPDGGREAFVSALAAQGIGETDVLAEVRRQLAGRELFDKVTRDVEVTDEELRATYDADPRAYDLPVRRKLRHVVVEDEAAGRAVVAALRKGGDFSVLAAQFSLDASTKDTGGDLGVLSADQLDPAFAKVAFATPAGQLFGPVQTSLGWHVGVVDQVLPAQTTTYEQVVDQLREQQVTERAVTVWRAYLDDRVEQAEIEYAPDYRPADTSVRSEPVPSAAPSASP